MQFIMAGSSTPRVFLPKLIEWYKQGVSRGPLMKTFEFEEINDRLGRTEAGRAIKPVF